MSTRAAAVALVLTLAAGGCAAPTKGAAPEPAVAAAAPAPAPPAPAPAPPPASAAPRQADQLARIASELAELQNAVAKLMMSGRQQDDQMLYLQRRLGDLETQARGRVVAPPGLMPPAAPSGPPPASLPPPPTSYAPPAPPPATLPRTARVTPPPTPAATAAPLVQISPSSPGDALYRAGLDKYEAGDLEAAVVTLYEVVATYPKDPARERAQFLVGEIFFTQKDYRGAVAEFENLVAAVPGGTRVPDALLRIGMAQRSLGDESRARRVWERLVKEHPNSAAARQARTLLRAARG